MITHIDFLIAVAVIVSICFMFRHVQNKNTRMEKELNHYRSTYLYKQGATSLWKGSNGAMLNYELRSFDAGVSWYAVQRQGELGQYLKILGEVETVYPGLMEHLATWDAITDHVTKNGPLKLDNAQDIGMLMKAGFSVKTN